MKELESALSGLRGREKPKSRFTFGARAPAPAKASTSEQTVGEPSELQAVPVPGPAAGPSTSHSLSNQYQSRLTTSNLDPPPEKGTTYTLSLDTLIDCIIDLRPPSSTNQSASKGSAILTSLHAKNLRRCILVLPVLKGSLMITDIEDCLIVVGAQQVSYLDLPRLKERDIAEVVRSFGCILLQIPRFYFTLRVYRSLSIVIA